MHIVVDAPLPDECCHQIQQLSPGITLEKVPPPGHPLPAALVKKADVIYTSSADFNPADAPRLRWVQTNSAATNPFRRSLIVKTPTPIANASGAYSVPVAECAIGMLLAVNRRLTLACRDQAASRWPEDYSPYRGIDLHGMTMGIVGYGSIGRQIARLANAMGMAVLACKRSPERKHDDSYLLPGTGDPDGLIPEAWFGHGQIREMFALCNVAMVTLPDVPTTAGIIGSTELRALPREAVFVNVGRGEVVDEAALSEFLRSGAIAAAALDVFATEPLPATSPFWEMPNVLVTPHIASWTQRQATYAAGVLIENLKRDLCGRPLINLINKTLLY